MSFLKLVARCPPPRKLSRPGWMGFWATQSSRRCPCPWQGGWN